MSWRPAAVHTHLVRQGLRSFAQLNVRSAECLDTHYFAVLIGVGATTVNAYLAQERDRRPPSRAACSATCRSTSASQRYRKAVDEGLLKIMSKMGIAVISSYRGGYNFEAVGLSRALVDDFFPGMPSRDLRRWPMPRSQLKALELRTQRPATPDVVDPAGRRLLPPAPRRRDACLSGAADPPAADRGRDRQLLRPTSNSRAGVRRAAAGRSARPARVQLPGRGAIAGRRGRERSPRSASASSRPGMSLGALAPEAHETLAIAMNRIGAKRGVGRGRRGPGALQAAAPTATTPTRRSSRSPRAASASPREYLNDCREIEIKVAQGAKPGEGGQLPGFKVTELIAKLRHSTPGVMLI